MNFLEEFRKIIQEGRMIIVDDKYTKAIKDFRVSVGNEEGDIFLIYTTDGEEGKKVKP